MKVATYRRIRLYRLHIVLHWAGYGILHIALHLGRVPPLWSSDGSRHRGAAIVETADSGGRGIRYRSWWVFKTAGHFVRKKLMGRRGRGSAARVVLHGLLVRRRGQLLLVQQVLVMLKGLLISGNRSRPPHRVIPGTPRGLVLFRHLLYEHERTPVHFSKYIISCTSLNRKKRHIKSLKHDHSTVRTKERPVHIATLPHFITGTFK